LCPEKILSDDRQPTKPAPTQQADVHGRVSKAREAAEALFRPKSRAPIETSNGSASVELEPLRKPRIILVPPAGTRRETVAPVTEPKKRRREIEPRALKISKSEYGRVRALVSYGMTLDEVADLYGVPATRIEKIVGAASDNNVI
jgi:hypothetical protein